MIPAVVVVKKFATRAEESEENTVSNRLSDFECRSTVRLYFF